jgi:DNA repair photolyase
MADFDNPGSVTTKGTLVTRDIDVMTDLASRADFSVNISLISLVREQLHKLEPGTPAPSSRLRAMERLTAAGIRVAVSLAPIIPGITDKPEEIEAVVKAAAEHGASDVWAGALRLAPGVKEHFLQTIEQHFPHLLQQYQRLYGGGAYAPTAYQLRVESLISARRRAEGMYTPAPDPVRELRPAATRGQLALPI